MLFRSKVIGDRLGDRLATTYHHSECTMNKQFQKGGDRLKEDSCFLHRKRIANIQGPAFIMFLLSDQKAQFLLEDKLLIAPFPFLLPSKV